MILFKIILWNLKHCIQYCLQCSFLFIYFLFIWADEIGCEHKAESYSTVISVKLWLCFITLPLLIVHAWVKFCMCTVFISVCAHAGLWMCVLCSWRCQVVPSTVGSWHAVRQWSDWSKTTREEQAELPAAISLPDSDGYGQGSQICSARLACNLPRNHSVAKVIFPAVVLVMCTGNFTKYLMRLIVSAA